MPRRKLTAMRSRVLRAMNEADINPTLWRKSLREAFEDACQLPRGTLAAELERERQEQEREKERHAWHARAHTASLRQQAEEVVKRYGKL